MASNRLIMFLVLAFICSQEMFGAAPADQLTIAMRKLDAALKKDDVATVRYMIENREIDPLMKSERRGLYLYQMAEGRKAPVSRKYLKDVFDQAKTFEAYRPKASDAGAATGERSAVAGAGQAGGRPAPRPSQTLYVSGTLGGAGVLPYAIDRADGKLYFLLGREKAGKAAGTWADFGGGAQASDRNDPMQNAAREFVEEVGQSFGDQGAVYRMLAKDGQILSQSEHGGNFFVGYIMQIPYGSASGLRGDQEKDLIMWFSADQLLAALDSGSLVRVVRGSKVTEQLRDTTLRSYRRNRAILEGLRNAYEGGAPAAGGAAVGGGVYSSAYEERGVAPAPREYTISARGKSAMTDEERLVQAIKAGDASEVLDIMPRLEGGTYARIPYVVPGRGHIYDPLAIARFEKKQTIINLLEPMRMQADAKIIIDDLQKTREGQDIDDDTEKDMAVFEANLEWSGLEPREHARLVHQMQQEVARIRKKTGAGAAAPPAPRAVGAGAPSAMSAARPAAPAQAPKITVRGALESLGRAGQQGAAQRQAAEHQQAAEKNLQASLRDLARDKETFIDRIEVEAKRAGNSESHKEELRALLDEFITPGRADIRTLRPSRMFEDFGIYLRAFRKRLDALSQEIGSYESRFDVRNSQLRKEFSDLYNEIMG